MIQDRRKTIVLALLGIIAIIAVVYFFIINIYVSVPGGKVEVGYVDNKGVVSVARSIGGIHMVPRSAESIVLQSGSSEVRVVATDKPFVGVMTVDTELVAQKRLSKIGKDSQSCSGRTDSGVVYTYSCTEGFDRVFTFANKKAGQFENQALSTTLNPDRFATYPYRNGVVSLVRLGDNMALEYTSVQDSDIRQRELPYSTNDTVKAFMNPSSDSIVVVNDTASKLLSYTSIDSEPVTYSIPKSVTYGTCAVADSGFACSATDKSENTDKDSHSTEEEEVAKESRIVSYDTASKKQSNFKVEGVVNSLCVAKDGIYYQKKDGVLRFERKAGGSFAIGSNVVSVSCGKDSLVYSDGSGLYKTKDGVSRLLLREGHLALSNAYLKGDVVLINTFVKSDLQTTLHTYQVTDDPVKGVRPERVLPYDIPGELPIFEMDYDDDTIYIKPYASITSDKQNGTTSVDVEALEITKQQIEKKLRDDGILDRYALVYYFN